MPHYHDVRLPLLSATAWATEDLKPQYVGSFAAFEAAEGAGIPTTDSVVHLRVDEKLACSAAERDHQCLNLFLRVAQAVGDTAQGKLTVFLHAVQQYGRLVTNKVRSQEVLPELYATAVATGSRALVQDTIALFPPEGLS